MARRHQKPHSGIFEALRRTLPHISAGVLAEVATAIPDVKKELAFHRHGGFTTEKGWKAQQRLGPIEILDAMNQLHQGYREGKDVHAPEHIQLLHDALGSLGRGFVIDPARHPLGELAEPLTRCISVVLVHTLRTLTGLIGPRGLHRDAQLRDANEVVRRTLTERVEEASKLFKVVNEKLTLKHRDRCDDSDEAHAAWVAVLETQPEMQLLNFVVRYSSACRAAEALALQFVNAPPKWRAHLFRCHNYPKCLTPYGLDRSHRMDRAARRCKGCRLSRRKATRNRTHPAVL